MLENLWNADLYRTFWACGGAYEVFLILRLASLAWSWATLNFETDSFLCSATWMSLVLTLKLYRGIEDFVLQNIKNNKMTNEVP